MKFTTEGEWNGIPFRVTWEDGELSGDEWAVDMLKNGAAIREGYCVGPPMGPVTIHGHLKDRLSTVTLMYWEGMKIKKRYGDPIPDGPHIPKDAES